MPTALALALSALAKASTPPTPATLLPLYTTLACYPSTTDVSHTGLYANDDALIAFEHALEKYPAGSPTVRKIRRAYWRERIQSGAATCACCSDKVCAVDAGGKLRAPVMEAVLAHILEEQPRPKTKRAGKPVKKRRTRAEAVSFSGDDVWVASLPRDPFAPSTSAHGL
ncbi:hypothetical protein BV25DRAFT_1817569 [Artomyces pyxidatus]|uniref:Uncharacterized protein n=1 Tax=Artomyces pyxidatus TaxID=48021 RepID=A0ACB8TJQ0_9AGAM|nr:hypothetical protein BV25DRAFT_1817569 [Artomyces pyxidatus]